MAVSGIMVRCGEDVKKPYTGPAFFLGGKDKTPDSARTEGFC